MRQSIHTAQRLVPVFCWMILIGTLSSSRIQAQEDFLITEAEMPGWELTHQSEFSWMISDSESHPVIEQIWHSVDTDTQECLINYAEFDSPIEAIRGTAYCAGTFVVSFTWGSLKGSILGDGGWVSRSGGAIFFVRGNVGIRIIVRPKEGNYREVMEEIAYKCFSKIEANLSQEILDLEQAARQKQMPEADYITIIEGVLSSPLMGGFTHHTSWDSKWVFETDSLTMGIRKEWKNAQGVVVGIDICTFDSDAFALSAAEAQTKNAYCWISWGLGVFLLDDLDSLKTLLDEWESGWKTGFLENLISIIGVKSNIAFHYYQFDTTGIDTGFVRPLVEKIAEQTLNF